MSVGPSTAAKTTQLPLDAFKSYHNRHGDLTANQRVMIAARETARRVYWSEYDRENHACQSCGADTFLEVHHRDRDALNNHLLNLIAVCHRCHRAAHKANSTHQRLVEWKRKFYENLTNRKPLTYDHGSTE